MNEDNQNKQQEESGANQQADKPADAVSVQEQVGHEGIVVTSEPSQQAAEESQLEQAKAQVEEILLDASSIQQSAIPGGQSEQSSGAEPQPVEVKPEINWYVVHVYSGFEFKVKQSLEERIRINNFSDMFGEIRIPQEKVVELVRGKKKTSNRKFFPGYILVQMALNQDTWHLVNETPKVTGFVGDSSDPAPLSEDEVLRIMDQVEEGASSPRSKMSFEQGETIKVVDGPFADFNGTVEEVRPEKGKVKVLISIFGRATPVELDFVQIEKI